MVTTTRFHQLVPEFSLALTAEIAAARIQGGDRYRMYRGRFLGKGDTGFLYQFRLESECHVPDDCGIDVRSGSQTVEGSVVSIEGFNIVVSTNAPLSNLGRAILVVKLWYVLERLRDRLTALREIPDAGALFDLSGQLPLGGHRGLPEDVLPLDKPRLNLHQRYAAARLDHAGAHFLWGPPGTGKTTTVGYACANAARRARILVVAYSNVALDVAMLAADDAADPELQRPGAMVRIGTPRKEEMRTHDRLPTLAVLRRTDPGLVEQFEALRDEQRRLVDALGKYLNRDTIVQEMNEIQAEIDTKRNTASNSKKIDILSEKLRDIKRLDEVRGELRKLREAIRTRERQLMREAQIVGCTLARLATDDTFVGNDGEPALMFDAVIVDEASMASIPFAALAACHGSRTVLYAGDFRQLPPVVVARDEPLADQYLKRDIFYHAGIPDAVRYRDTDPRLVTLIEQYRMHPDIAAPVSRLFYDGRLQDGNNVYERGTKIAEHAPFPGRSIRVIDIGSLRSQCLREPPELGRSRFNLLSSLVSILAALSASRAGHGSSALISPFRAQARLLRLLVEDLKITQANASTVHRFQGGEADAVIVDLATAHGHAKLGPLLSGDVWSDAGRLLNVAISRPRGKLIIVADLAHIRARASSTDAVRLVLDRIESVSLRQEQLGQQLATDADMIGKVRLLPGPLFAPGVIPFAAPASDELFISVNGDGGPPTWVQQAGQRGVRVTVRSASFHPSWNAVQNCGFVTAPSRLNAVWADRSALAVEVMEGGPTLVLSLPDTGAFIANLLELVPQTQKVATPKANTPEMVEQGPLGTTCDACGGVLWLEEGSYDYPIVRCLMCRKSRKPDLAMVNNYLKAMRKTCEQCGALPQAVNGSRGLYVRCSRPGCDWRTNLKKVL